MGSKGLIKELDRKCDNSQAGPEPLARTIWGGLWVQPSEHNRQAEWLANVNDELKNVQQQEGFQIDVNKVKKQLRKVPNWIAPGSDQVNGYWLKNFSSIQERIAQQLLARMISAWQCSDVDD